MTTKIHTFTGMDAMALAQAGNRQPELLDPATGHWSPAPAWRLRPIASREPERVRLRAGARALAEDIAGRALPDDGQPLAAQVAHACAQAPSGVQADALALLAQHLQAL